MHGTIPPTPPARPATVVAGLYSARDRVADMLIGGIQLHRHEAPAIRAFGDACSMQGSIVQLHPGDFELVRLGYLMDDHTIEPEFSVVITGAQWLAAQQPSNTEG